MSLEKYVSTFFGDSSTSSAKAPWVRGTCRGRYARSTPDSDRLHQGVFPPEARRVGALDGTSALHIAEGRGMRGARGPRRQSASWGARGEDKA